MAVNSLRFLLLLLLTFSHIITLNAIPTSRTGNLLGHRQDTIATFEKTHQVMTEESLEEMIINGRMDLEKNDYSESGPNGKHTPQPPA